MFIAVGLIKELFLTPIFLVIFFAVAANVFQQSLVFISYLIYIKIPSHTADDAFRILMANVLILKYLRNRNEGQDEELTHAADNLLLSLQYENSLQHIAEVNPQEVVDLDNAVMISGFVKQALLLVFLVALVVNYFG